MSKADALRAEARVCRETAEAIRKRCAEAEGVAGFLTAHDRALELEREAIRLEAQASEAESVSRRGGWWSFWQPAG